VASLFSRNRYECPSCHFVESTYNEGELGEDMWHCENCGCRDCPASEVFHYPNKKK